MKKYKKKNLIEKEKLNNNTKKILLELQIEKLKEHIKINWIFYIVVLCSLFILSRSIINELSPNIMFIKNIITFISISTLGYFTHYISHNVHFSEIYKEHSIIIKKKLLLDKILINFFKFVDFHREVHHNIGYENPEDTISINKKWKNIFYEIINNIVFQGIAIIIIKKCLNYLDNNIIILWALFYSTFHNINYNIIKPSSHRDHHINNKTNYGIDIYDIIFGTKYDLNDLENYNHYSINIIIITGLMIFVINLLYKNNNKN